MKALRERQRQSWEPLVLSICITTVLVVATICLIILVIYAAIFGAASLRNHTP